MFLHPARARGLDVRTDARAARILFEGKRRSGCRYVHDRDRSVTRTVRARREVIVSAGTANTAKLLQISGVGPAALLGTLGVPVVHELAGVGENFRDHYSVRMVARVKGIRTMNEMSRGLGLAGQIARWMVGKPSILALSSVVDPLVLEIVVDARLRRSAGRVQPGELQGRVRRACSTTIRA